MHTHARVCSCVCIRVMCVVRALCVVHGMCIVCCAWRVHACAPHVVGGVCMPVHVRVCGLLAQALRVGKAKGSVKGLGRLERP